MTTNIERAADVIDRWSRNGGELNSHVGNPDDLAQALAYATPPVLMPDLPKSDDGVWTPTGSVISIDGALIFQMIESGMYTPAQTRTIAYALLAAANHAEQEQGNG